MITKRGGNKKYTRDIIFINLDHFGEECSSPR